MATFPISPFSDILIDDYWASQSINQDIDSSYNYAYHSHTNDLRSINQSISLHDPLDFDQSINHDDQSAKQCTNHKVINQSVSHQSINQSADRSAKDSSRRKQHIACLACYTGKTSCNGQRPCSRCVRLEKTCKDRPAKESRNHSLSHLVYQSNKQIVYQSNNHVSSEFVDRFDCAPVHALPVPAIVLPEIDSNQPYAPNIRRSTCHQSNSPILHRLDDKSSACSNIDSDRIYQSSTQSYHSYNTFSRSPHQSVAQSPDQSDSDSEDEYDARSFTLMNPEFHRLLSQTMCEVQLNWFADQSSSQSLEPFQMNGLFGKLVYYNWLICVMQPDDVARVLHDTSFIGDELPVTLAMKEIEKHRLVNPLNRMMDKTTSRLIDLNSAKRLTNTSKDPIIDFPSAEQFIDQSFDELPSRPCELIQTSTYQSATQKCKQSFNHSTNQSINQLSKAHTPNHPVIHSINRSCVTSINQCCYSSCDKLCSTFHEWFASHPFLMTYCDSPSQSINQSINQSSMTPSSMFDYPCLIESVVNGAELSSESMWRNVLNNTLTQSTNLNSQSTNQPIRLRMSLSVNSAFERMFGYSQADLRNLSLQHGGKCQIALFRPDYWYPMLMKEQDASFARICEHVLSMVCITKWGGQIHCTRHTKFVSDEMGRYKEFVSLFIPLDIPCPPYKKRQQRKHKRRREK